MGSQHISWSVGFLNSRDHLHTVSKVSYVKKVSPGNVRAAFEEWKSSSGSRFSGDLHNPAHAGKYTRKVRQSWNHVLFKMTVMQILNWYILELRYLERE